MPPLETYVGCTWPGMAIRCCSAEEVVAWGAGPLVRQGAGYTLDDDDVLRRLEACIRGGRAGGATHVVLLGDAPMAVMVERYNFGAAQLTLKKINGVMNGTSRMLANFPIGERNLAGDYVRSDAAIAFQIINFLPWRLVP